MKNLIEFSIHGDIYLFLDSLSEEEFAIVSAYVKKRFGSHQLDDHQIDTFISEVSCCYGITLKRVLISRVIAV